MAKGGKMYIVVPLMAVVEVVLLSVPSVINETTMETNSMFTYHQITFLFIALLTICFLMGCGEGFNTKNESEGVTSANKDTMPPFVVATIPGDGECDVPEDIKVIVQFSEAIKKHLILGSLSITSDKLEKEELKPSCEYSLILFSTKFKISFPSSLRNDETYTLRLDGNRIIDTAGNRMEQDYKFTFTVEGISPIGKPRVSDQTLSYLVWQDTDGIWHIIWNSDWYWHLAAPPSGSGKKPKRKPKPRPGVEQIYELREHLFTGTIISNEEFKEHLVEEVDFDSGDKWDLSSMSMLDAELLQVLEEKNLIPVGVDMESADKNVIIFEAETGGADSSDGLAFKCDGTEFVFELKIDDEYYPDRIFIGDKRKNPREVPFKLKPRELSRKVEL